MEAQRVVVTQVHRNTRIITTLHIRKKKSNDNSVNLIKKIDLDLHDDNEDINETIIENLFEE